MIPPVEAVLVVVLCGAVWRVAWLAWRTYYESVEEEWEGSAQYEEWLAARDHENHVYARLYETQCRSLHKE